MFRDEGNNKSGTSYECNLPILRVPTQAEPVTYTEAQLTRSQEIEDSGLEEKLRQIVFRIQDSKERLAQSEEIVAQCDGEIKRLEHSLAGAAALVQTRQVLDKTEDLQQKLQAVAEQRQEYIKWVGRMTNLVKQNQAAYDAFPHEAFRARQEAEKALAGL